jgi:hypothetical protein
MLAVLLGANCNLLGYRWHRSICYTGLFTTPRVVITISPYNDFWPSDVLPRSGPLISSSSECWQLTDWLLVTDWLFVTDWLVKVKVTLRQTLSQSVSLGIEPHLGLVTRYLLLFDSYGLVSCGAPSLTRGRVCLLYMLLAIASAVFLTSESLGTRDHILLSQIWDFPFRRLLRLAGSRWRYSTPPPYGYDLLFVTNFLKSSASVPNRKHLVARFSFLC